MQGLQRIVEVGDLDQAISDVVKEILPNVVDKTIVEGGNFQIRGGKYQVHPICTSTFKAAVQLVSGVREADKSKQNSRQVRLGFLVDNFSIRGKEFRFPDDYYSLTENFDIGFREVALFWESNLRNRAKNSIIKCVDNGSIVLDQHECGDGTKSQCFLAADDNLKVANLHDELKVPTPIGCALLAQKLLDCEKAGYKMAISFMHEGSYEVKDCSFVDVFRLFGGKIPVINVWFAEQGDSVQIKIIPS